MVKEVCLLFNPSISLANSLDIDIKFSNPINYSGLPSFPYNALFEKLLHEQNIPSFASLDCFYKVKAPKKKHEYKIKHMIANTKHVLPPLLFMTFKMARINRKNNIPVKIINIIAIAVGPLVNSIILLLSAVLNHSMTSL